jgi:folylpolyglutamate synthase
MQVDATVLEVGIGGLHDSTNLVPRPFVAGVTSLGLDHVNVLGKTIGEIASHKGGIYKPGVPAFSVEQEPEGAERLHWRAMERGAASYNIVPVTEAVKKIKLGLAGEHQRINASLAVALVQTFLSSYPDPPHVPINSNEESTPPSLPKELVSPDPLPEKIIQGLEKAKWPGRCQVEWDGEEGKGVRWWMDGAHTKESLEKAGEWWRAVERRK